MSDGILVLKGAFDAGTSPAEVLGVVGISRQWMEVRFFDGADEPHGRLLCKSGFLVEADARGRRPGIDAFVGLFQQPGRGFRVYQRHAPARPGPPLGALPELIARAETAPKPAEVGRRELVLDGTFGRFVLSDLLDVLTLGRQRYELTTVRADGSEVVTEVIAGRLLRCEDPGRGAWGVDALGSLIREPGVHYRVTRIVGPVPVPDPIGLLRTLLDRVPPEPSNGVRVVREGSLADWPLADVLSFVARAPGRVELVLRDASGTRGSLIVRDGDLVDAREVAAGKVGREAVLALLRDPGTAFSVVQRPPDAVRNGAPPAIGRLSEVTSALAAVGLVRRTVADERPLLLSGAFDRIDPAELCAVLQATRQHAELVFTDGGAPVGAIRVKSGRILAASGAGLEGMAAAHALVKHPSGQFRLEAVDGPVPDASIGTVAELRPAAARENGTQVEGRFGALDVRELVQQMGRSKQVTEILLLRDQRPWGRILVQSGELLGAWHAGDNGAVAMRALLADPGTSYLVGPYQGKAEADSLGPVSGWTVRMPQRAAPTETAAILAGSFAGVSPVDLLRALSYARQHLAVAFLGVDGARGRVVLKSGRWLSAELTTDGTVRNGEAAIRGLCATGGVRYEVTRATGPIGEPGGRLADVLATIAQPPPTAPRPRDPAASLPPTPTAPSGPRRAVVDKPAAKVGVAEPLTDGADDLVERSITEDATDPGPRRGGKSAPPASGDPMTVALPSLADADTGPIAEPNGAAKPPARPTAGKSLPPDPSGITPGRGARPAPGRRRPTESVADPFSVGGSDAPRVAPPPAPEPAVDPAEENTENEDRKPERPVAWAEPVSGPLPPAADPAETAVVAVTGRDLPWPPRGGPPARADEEGVVTEVGPRSAGSGQDLQLAAALATLDHRLRELTAAVVAVEAATLNAPPSAGLRVTPLERGVLMVILGIQAVTLLILVLLAVVVLLGG